MLSQITNNDPQACHCGTKAAHPRKPNSKTPYCGTLEENKNSYQDILSMSTLTSLLVGS
jgi:hypothetical protein